MPFTNPLLWPHRIVKSDAHFRISVEVQGHSGTQTQQFMNEFGHTTHLTYRFPLLYSREGIFWIYKNNFF